MSAYAHAEAGATTLYPDLERPAGGAAMAISAGATASAFADAEPAAHESARGDLDFDFAAEIGFIVSGDGDLESTARAVSGKLPGAKIVCVTTTEAETAHEDDDAYEVVNLRDRHATLGRVRNAGYRRLKKILPGMSFVHFVEPELAFYDEWFDNAVRFFDRRPEVAAVEGRVTVSSDRATRLSDLWELSRDDDAGERVAIGDTFLVRTDAFEAAGGFRGDVPGVETADLCIRLRKRGAHVWRVDADMGDRAPQVRTVGQWFASSTRNGANYALGAGLHGAAPERFRVTEQARALIWGALFPVFVFAAAALCASMAFFMRGSLTPLFAAAGVVAIGAMAYALKIVAIAFRRGIFSLKSWQYAMLVSLGHFSEAAGVFGAWLRFRGRRRRRVAAA